MLCSVLNQLGCKIDNVTKNLIKQTVLNTNHETKGHEVVHVFLGFCMCCIHELLLEILVPLVLFRSKILHASTEVDTSVLWLSKVMKKAGMYLCL